MQRISHTLRHRVAALAVDTVICGDILRIVVDGVPTLMATNPVEALLELRECHEDFRQFIIGPPRGHEDISACLLFAPFSSNADRTAVIAPQLGYVPLAGTPLLSAAAALIETGQLPVTEPETTVTFDTAKGQSRVVATIENGRCVSTRWITDPPKIIEFDQPVTIFDGRTVPVSVLSMGLPYVVARARDLSVDLRDENALGALGAEVSRAAGRDLPLKRFGLDQDASAYVALIIGEVSVESGHPSVQIAWIAPSGWVARSTGGTGALCAAAFLTQSGKLEAGETLYVISPVGNGLHCKIETQSAFVEATVRITALVELLSDMATAHAKDE